MAWMMGKQEDRGSLQEQLDEVSSMLHAVLDVGMSGLEAKDPEEQLYDVLQTLIDLFKADAAAILLREGNSLAAFMSLGAEEDAVERFTVFMGQGFAGKIAETKEHLYVHDAQEDPIVISPYVKKAGIRSMLGVPLLYGGETIGVLHVDWLKTRPFSEAELEVLKVASERCASAIAIARMCEINNDLNMQACMYLDIIEHDLKNLDKVMLEDLDTVLSIPGLDREAKDTVEGVKADVMESETLINNVRVLHRTLNEALPVETMDVDELIEKAIEEVDWPEGKNVEIRYTPQMGRAVNGNELLKDVFYTLMKNAVMCSRGDVAIDVKVDQIRLDMQPYYTVTIADNSQEIPDETREGLFAFHLGLTQAHGKALPLFLVKLVLDRMGGDIRVENRVPGDYRQGSEFIVTLPAIEARVVPELEPAYRFE
jgi:K+-sensing histidine kinase KdpD